MIFLQVILPVLLIFLSGYLLQRVFKLDLRPISTLAIYVLTTALVFRTFYKTALDLQLFHIVIISLLLLGALVLVTLLTAKLFKYDKQQESAMLLSTAFMNSGNYGTPIILFAFGQAGFTYAVQIIVFLFFPYHRGIMTAMCGWRQGSLSWSRKASRISCTCQTVNVRSWRSSQVYSKRLCHAAHKKTKLSASGPNIGWRAGSFLQVSKLPRSLEEAGVFRVLSVKRDGILHALHRRLTDQSEPPQGKALEVVTFREADLRIQGLLVFAAHGYAQDQLFFGHVLQRQLDRLVDFVQRFGSFFVFVAVRHDDEIEPAACGQ